MTKNQLAADLDQVLADVGDLWEELRGKRIFLTGGTGFFGCCILESLMWANDKLRLNTSAVVLTRNPQEFRRKAPHLASHALIELWEGDVRSFSFPAGGFSHVIHAAAELRSNFAERNPLSVFDTIVSGTRHTLDFAVEAGAAKVLLTSSGAVYGTQQRTTSSLSETYVGAPDCSVLSSAYGEAKRVSELLCSVYYHQHGIEAKIARCFTFVGPYLPLRGGFAVGNFIGDGLRGSPINVSGDGTSVRSYLYTSDLVSWLWTILIKGVPNRPYNVGAEEPISTGQLAHLVAGSFQERFPVRIQGHAISGSAPSCYVPCTRRAREELGLKQTVGLLEAIKRTICWHRVAGEYSGRNDKSPHERCGAVLPQHE